MTFKETFNPKRFDLPSYFVVFLFVVVVEAILCFLCGWSLKSTAITVPISYVILIFFILAVEDLDGDTRERVIDTKKETVEKYGVKFKADVPNKVVREVYYKGEWREILQDETKSKGVKLEKAKSK